MELVKKILSKIAKMFLMTLSQTIFTIALLTGPFLRLYFFQTGIVPVIAAVLMLILCFVAHKITPKIPKPLYYVLTFLLMAVAGAMLIFTGFVLLIQVLLPNGLD